MGANLSTFPDISVSERFVPGPEGAPEVPVLVYLPIAAQAPLSALLWIHGGGSVMGEASQDDLAVSQIVSAVGCVAVSVDYRLAPETPHPGQIEDGYAALRWLSTHAGELGVDPARIAIGGASAGGGTLRWVGAAHPRPWRNAASVSGGRSGVCPSARRGQVCPPSCMSLLARSMASIWWQQPRSCNPHCAIREMRISRAFHQPAEASSSAKEHPMDR